jgi:hypothetical protein
MLVVEQGTLTPQSYHDLQVHVIHFKEFKLEREGSLQWFHVQVERNTISLLGNNHPRQPHESKLSLNVVYYYYCYYYYYYYY